MNLEELWQEYQSALRAFLLKRVADHDDVEDLLQEVLIKTHQGLSDIRAATSVKSWLFQVANRTTINFIDIRQKRML
ncbi:sigma factor [Litorilituus lipolyticus]|uniref:sigma factor n=1 Tax=Litorilituus lipolyticus TaxID=2491017 RepID=UPI001FE8B905|nr:sigma factor [Litorilituus lipolyticus]